VAEERTIQTPDWAVFVGGWSVEQLVSLDHVSSRLRPFATLELRVDNEDGAAAEKLTEGAEVLMGVGDRETGLLGLFHGEVEEVQPERVLTLRARDKGMLGLARAHVTRSWLRVTPQEVARAVLDELGVAHGLGSAELPRRHHVVARGLSVLELLQQMDRQWQLGWDLYCEVDGTVWWGPWDESPRYQRALNADLTILVEGDSLLGLEPSGVDIGTAKTWLLPELQHSGLVGLVDARFWLERRLARLERVTHRVRGPRQGGSRTELEWRLVA
jgi:hypothetical protein